MVSEWVEVEWVVAQPAERRADLPEDTRQVGYMARTRGIAVDPAIGEIAEILSPTGRRQVGSVVSIRPGYTHTFGAPVEAWVQMREAIRVLIHGLAEEATGQ